MGSSRKPGPLCSSDAGLTEDGTNCLASSPEPGPIGTEIEITVDPSLDAANPLIKEVDRRTDEEKDMTRGVIGYAIDLIARSEAGKSGQGPKIVKVLSALNKQNKIMYAETGDARGEWSGEWIRINQEFSNKVGPTLVELFHEGTHALWRKNHAEKKKKNAADREADIQDEINAQKNQLKMYVYAKSTWNYSDIELNERADRLTRGDEVFDNHVRANFHSGQH